MIDYSWTRSWLGWRWLLVWLLLCGLTVTGSATPYTISSLPNIKLSDRRAFVCDPDGILSAETAGELNAALGRLADSLGVEVAVVAVERIADGNARAFAGELLNFWGVGKKGLDNGLVVLLVTDPEQRAVAFETGYGLEEVLPDAICMRIQQRVMLPLLRQGDYDAGLLAGVEAVCQRLYERLDPLAPVSKSFPLWGFIGGCVVLCGLIVVGVLYLTREEKLRCPRCGKRGLRYRGVSRLVHPTFEQTGLEVQDWVCPKCGYIHPVERILPIRSQRQVRIVVPLATKSPSSDDECDDDSWPVGGFPCGLDGENSPLGGHWGGGRSGGGGACSRF